MSFELGDFAKLQGGFAFKSKDFDSVGIPVIKIANVTGGGFVDLSSYECVDEKNYPNISEYLTSEDDVLIAMTGANVGKVVRVGLNQIGCAINQRVGRLKIKSNCEYTKDFFYYVLSSSSGYEYFVTAAYGSAQPNISGSLIEKLPIPSVEPRQANQFSKFLRNVDNKIELNRQINQTLEQMAQAIFQSWFVDFEPVKAKIAAREDWLARQAAQSDAHDDAPQFSSPVCYAHEFADPAAPAPATQADLETFMNRAAMCTISGKTDADLDAMPAADYQRLYHTASLFPDELVDSELGEIPKGWEVVKIEDVIARLSVGKKFSQKTVSPEGNVPVLDQGKSGVIGFHNEEPGVNASVREPVIVFANHTCYMRLIMYPFSAIQNVLPFKGNELNTLWTYFATQGKQEFVEYKGHWPDFVIKQIVKPDSRLAEIFSKKIMASMELIYKNELQSEVVTKLRDTLLPKLLSGELDCSSLTD